MCMEVPLHTTVSGPVTATGAASTVTVVVLVPTGQGPAGVLEVKVSVTVPAVNGGV